jgi:hypothetical protein
MFNINTDITHTYKTVSWCISIQRSFFFLIIPTFTQWAWSHVRRRYYHTWEWEDQELTPECVDTMSRQRLDPGIVKRQGSCYSSTYGSVHLLILVISERVPVFFVCFVSVLWSSYLLHPLYQFYVVCLCYCIHTIFLWELHLLYSCDIRLEVEFEYYWHLWCQI